MTTTELIDRLRKMSIKWKAMALWRKDEWRVMREAADRLMELRAKLDPMWDQWLIMDEGLFLSEIGEDGDSDWTAIKDQAVSFSTREAAQKYLASHFMEIGGGCVVLRGDVDAAKMNIEFFYDQD